METQHQHLWTREGHLTALTLDRHQLEELSEAEHQAVRAHLEGCDLCQGRQRRQRSFDQALCLPPLPALGQAHGARPAAPPQPQAAPAPRGGRVLPFPRWAVAAAGLAAAAALLLLWPSVQAPEDDGLRLKGRALPTRAPVPTERPFSWEVFVNDDSGTRAVVDGDTVYPGQRLGFRVHPRHSGHLLIVGVDDRGQDYLCYPQRQGGQGALVAASDKPYSLEEAVRLDEVTGHERLLALFCPEPVSLEQIGPALLEAVRGGADELPVLRPGCAQRDITLLKEPAPR